MIKVSNRAKAIEPSLSRQLFNMASQYDDVIDLTLGDPDLVPHEVIRNAACAAIQAGKTRYSANAGILELREAIAQSIKREYGFDFDAASEIAVTVGGMEALSLSLNCILDPGDEVIVFAPYYVNYIQMIRMCGALPIVIECDASNGFAIDVEDIRKRVSPKTVAMIINTPCNPTGVAVTGDTLDALAELAIENDLVVVSDEVYKTLLYDGRIHQSILTRPGMRERTILIDSASKRFAMTGYRLGYAAGPEGVISNVVKMQENVAACAPLPSQYAVLAAYRELGDDTSIRDTFAARRDCVFEGISSIPKLHCVKPDGAFYLFVDVSDTGLDGMTFATELLQSEHVAVVPGVTYGASFTGYVRIAYTVEVPILEQAIEKIVRFVNGLQ